MRDQHHPDDATDGRRDRFGPRLDGAVTTNDGTHAPPRATDLTGDSADFGGDGA